MSSVLALHQQCVYNATAGGLLVQGGVHDDTFAQLAGHVSAGVTVLLTTSEQVSVLVRCNELPSIALTVV